MMPGETDVKYLHFLIAWIFVLVPGPLIAHAGNVLATQTHTKVINLFASFLGTAEFWWWLVALPWVFVVY
jgi:hypothetical protein